MSLRPSPTIRDLEAEVTSVQHHPWPYFTVRMAVGADFPRSRAGQFVMVAPGHRLEPYLRRAFSVFEEADGADGLEIEIFGKVVGRGTRALAELRSGDLVPVMGPLGQGFRVDGPAGEQRPALVAGGIGSAALLLLARNLAAVGRPFDFYYGGRAKEDLALRERFEEPCAAAGGEFIVSTEDGGAGHTGYITEPLEQAFSAGRHDVVYTCGPEGLMARVAELAQRHGVGGQAALETEMGCGFGACLGCAVPHVDGRYRLCCKDGPAFDLDEVVW